MRWSPALAFVALLGFLLPLAFAPHFALEADQVVVAQAGGSSGGPSGGSSGGSSSSGSSGASGGGGGSGTSGGPPSSSQSEGVASPGSGGMGSGGYVGGGGDGFSAFAGLFWGLGMFFAALGLMWIAIGQAFAAFLTALVQGIVLAMWSLWLWGILFVLSFLLLGIYGGIAAGIWLFVVYRREWD